ncbi:hypothetical protein [Zavarzinia sp. CC-PAN008]|uniref:hypothetical protein n=1 Tax=Zavarzinia sp. CC-PAN008 TaxID=3243332 RepID=UPI003F748E8B
MIRPDVTTFLAHVSADLAGRIAPIVEPRYLKGALGGVAGMISVVADEWDRAADRLARENAAIRDLFRQALPVLGGDPLAGTLAALAEGREPDIRVSTLAAANGDLRRALIDLHAWTEDQQGPAAKALEAAIWRELAASVERRRLAAATF